MNARTIFAAALIAGTTMAGATMPAASAAARPVKFASDVFVEKFVPAHGGRMNRILERADRLQSGDRVIFVVNWTADAARPFTVTNTVPSSIAFQRTAEDAEDVSIDGGKTWGKLADMRVTEADGSVRHATPDDVTTLRWRVPTRIAAAGTGQITYSGVVR
ncbi:hypothetical protein RXV95_09030 [Novosphingobium sp. ZN18A2]|uniref:hypothetical protein n=1 Tax=Novosphingobium sp. ZN18A2 TaxID=3079861 RepID=UPI0030D0A421